LKALRVVAWAAALAVLVGLIQYVHGDWPFDKEEPHRNGPPRSHEVGPEGGALSFDGGVVITVPKGAVDRKATLAITSPDRVSDHGTVPFKKLNKPTVVFDVSLKEGTRSIQPRKPLRMSVSLKDAWLPTGAKPVDAKVYTPLGGGLALMPSKLDGNRLTISMGHLSPKYVSYVSDADLVASFDADKTEKDPSTCSQQVAISGGKVIFGATQGWAIGDKNSPVYACLYKGQDGYVRVGVLNRVDYIVSIAATSNVRIAEATGDAETEATKAIQRTLFPAGKVKALVGGGDTLVASIRIDDLPETLELRADPNVFFSASFYRLLSLAVDLLVDKTGSQTLEAIESLMGNVDLVTCLQSVVNDMGNSPSVGSIFQGSMKCVSTIVEAIAKTFKLEGLFWGKVSWVIDAITTIIATATDAWNGIRLTINDTIRIPVVAEMDAPVCPSGKMLDGLVTQPIPPPGVRVLRFSNKVEICHQEWAFGESEVKDTDGMDSMTPFVLRNSGGTWRLAYEGQEPGYSPPCREPSLPGDIRRRLGC
jgi:hypothetical protein